MEIKDKKDLINLVKLASKNNSFAKKEVLELIRDASIEFFLKKGEILPDEFMELYKNFYNLKIDSSEYLDNHIKFFKSYYEKAQLDEKYILNNFLFILEFLNGKDGLEEFVKRTFTFNAHNNNLYYKKAKEFLLNLKIEDKKFFEIFKNLFDKDYFFNLDEFNRRSIFVNTLIMWNNKVLFNNKNWLSLFDDLVNLIDEAIKRDLIEEVMYIQFFIYHIYGNSIQTIDEWRIFNEKIEKKTSKFFKSWGEKNNLIKPKKRVSTKKKKIGFLWDRVVKNSPFMVTYSLIKNLMENEEFKKNYEIYFYSMSYIDKQQDDIKLIEKLKQLGVKVYVPFEFYKDGFYYSHLQKALHLRSKIIEDKIDYLINPVSGYDIANFIFSTRSAPKQIYWSHGNCTSEIENIDKRISHFEQECKEFKWQIFDVPMAKEFLVGSEEEKEKGLLLKKELLAQFGKDTVFLGTIGRYVKIDSDEYLKVISEIMKENPNTIYLACGEGDKESIIKKLKKYGIDESRFIFTGLVNPHIFGWIIDIWLDTFPLPQGQSRDEYQAKNCGNIVFGFAPKARRDKKWFKKYYNDFFSIAFPSNCDEYIKAVNIILRNNDIKEELKRIDKEIFEKIFYADTNFVKKVLNV